MVTRSQRPRTLEFFYQAVGANLLSEGVSRLGFNLILEEIFTKFSKDKEVQEHFKNTFRGTLRRIFKEKWENVVNRLFRDSGRITSDENPTLVGYAHDYMKDRDSMGFHGEIIAKPVAEVLQFKEAIWDKKSILAKFLYQVGIDDRINEVLEHNPKIIRALQKVATEKLKQEEERQRMKDEVAMSLNKARHTAKLKQEPQKRLLEVFFESVGKYPNEKDDHILDVIVETLLLPQFRKPKMRHAFIETFASDIEAEDAFRALYAHQMTHRNDASILKKFPMTKEAFKIIRESIWTERYGFLKTLQELGIMSQFDKAFHERIDERKSRLEGVKSFLEKEIYRITELDMAFAPSAGKEKDEVFIKKALQIVSADPDVMKDFQEKFPEPQEMILKNPSTFFKFAQEHGILGKIAEAAEESRITTVASFFPEKKTSQVETKKEIPVFPSKEPSK